MSEITSRGSADGAISAASCHSVSPAWTVTCSKEVDPARSVATAPPPLMANASAAMTSGRDTTTVSSVDPRLVIRNRGSALAPDAPMPLAAEVVAALRVIAVGVIAVLVIAVLVIAVPVIAVLIITVLIAMPFDVSPVPHTSGTGSRRFVSDTRPGVPDTKLCSEHTFDASEYQVRIRHYPQLHQDTLEQVFACTTDRGYSFDCLEMT